MRVSLNEESQAMSLKDKATTVLMLVFNPLTCIALFVWIAYLLGWGVEIGGHLPPCV
jgi:hypothetical protein